MKNLVYIVIVVLLISIVGCSPKDTQEETKLTVAVSIAPQEGLIKEIAGDLVDVVTLIPSGASPTNYQPSPNEMSAFQEAKLYFTIGVPTEVSNILPNVASNNDDIKIVYLDDIVAETYDARYFEEDEHEDHEEDEHEDHEEDEHEDHEEDEQEDQGEDEHDHSHEGRDPHIWLSPRRVVVMVDEIAKELALIDPDNKAVYEENAQKFISELELLDNELTEAIGALDNKSFIIMHPSLGYFADDYGLTMIALEQDGKESSASHLQEVIEYAKDNSIKVVFYQTEFDSSQAKTLASEIDGEVLAIETLSNEYLSNMNDILKMFEDVLN